MTPLPFHRYANIFPLIDGEELRDLAEDIRLYGVRKPIDVLDGAILDGRNRYNALRLLQASGAPLGAGWGAYEGQPLSEDAFDVFLPWFRKYSIAESGDPLDYVWSLNYRRRDLTASQRAACAAEYEGYKHGGARAPAPDPQAANLQLGLDPDRRVGEGAEGAAPTSAVPDETRGPAAAPPGSPYEAPPLTRAERAEKHGVSERTLADADKVHDRSPELHEAVKAGEVTADVAATLVEKPAEEVKALIAALPRDETGKLTPDAKKEVRRVAAEVRAETNEQKRQRREAREREQGQAQLALPGETYGVILEDPEWDFQVYSRDTGMDRHAANHYAVSPDAALEQRDVASIAADNCVYGLWTADLARGLDLMRKRGFTFKSYFVWVKDIVDYPIDPATLKALSFPEGRYLRVIGPPGTGFWNRDRDEILLIGVKGNPPCPAPGTQGESVWFAARPHIEGSERDRHSAKPDICFDWFDRHFPSFRKIELNARAARPGWDAWGLEAPVSAADGAAGGPGADTQGSDAADALDGDDSGLPALPWAAGEDDAAHAADAGAESDNEAEEAGAHA